MDERTVMANRTGGRNRFMMATSVANQLIGVAMKSERKKTIGTEDLVATVFADCERGRAAAIMKKQSLFVLFEIIFDVLQQSIGKIAIAREKGAIFKVDEANFSLASDRFSLFGEGDVGVILLC